jgi:hypothetical protein
LGISDAVTNPTNEIIAQGIIHASVHRNLTYNLLDLPLAACVYEHLISKFCVVNRAAQLQMWNKLINVNPLEHTTTAALYKKFATLGKTFNKQGICLSWEDIMCLVMQKNLKDAV